MIKTFALLLAWLLVSCGSSYAVSLQWDLNTGLDQVTAYKIYRVGKSSNTMIGSVNGNTNTFSVDGLTIGKRTTFYVTAVNTIGESLPSSKVTVQKH